MVRGIQSNGVIANAKHFIGNTQEGFNNVGDRHDTSSNLSMRALRELYLPPFEGAVEAGVLSIMCANNLVNNTFACENKVLNDILKIELGFSGWICSDYGT